jgi:hypothetical protein
LDFLRWQAIAICPSTTSFRPDRQLFNPVSEHTKARRISKALSLLQTMLATRL